jgi:FMN-dependent NADH-azoreductase
MKSTTCAAYFGGIEINICNVIREKMALLDPAVFAAAPTCGTPVQMRSQFHVNRSFAAFRNEDDVVFAVPFRVA